MLNVLLHTTPLRNANAIRGVGMYTKFLLEFLKQQPDIKVFTSMTEAKQAQVKLDLQHYPFFDLFFPTLPLFKSIPTVVTIHDVIPLVFPEQYPAGKRGSLSFYYQKLALKQAAAVVTDSRASQADIIKYLEVPSEKVHVTYLAANPELQPATRAQQLTVQEHLHLPPDYILYVGDINYNKNIPQLIKALKFLPNPVHLVCVGKNFYPHQIPEWHWIETQIALSDVAARIHFVTEVGVGDTQDLAALYSGALAYVQPSLYEGFGLPVLEAMRCQTPVISTKNSSLTEVGGEHAVFVEPTAEAIAEAVEQVQAWTKSARSNWIAGATAWSNEFSWQKTAAETAAVYQKIVQSHV